MSTSGCRDVFIAIPHRVSVAYLVDENGVFGEYCLFMSKVEEVRDVVRGGSVGVEPLHHPPVRRVHLRVPMYNVLVL